jgi:hypothetical protein
MMTEAELMALVAAKNPGTARISDQERMDALARDASMRSIQQKASAQAKAKRDAMKAKVIAWVRANPRRVWIALACAIAFNYVIYPALSAAYYTYGCDKLPTGTGVVLCHIAHNPTFLGSLL